ncbi:VanZ family protein [Metasolibacillus meyeri]|uniref:VanZ family protein n=1 Tax=Metasolibacillus meyeri TaxID=1071052 RepID=UPI000D302FE8|nr:VanZ family protein [Metasolibacillus meyeri]
MKKRNFIMTITTVYTALILYFMFFGFNRLEGRGDYIEAGYEFLFVPTSVPLTFPDWSFSWLYDFGNIAAFIPFGILVPLLMQINYKKFIGGFLLVIFGLETLQTLLYLGTFDIDDVISNTLGATIGYVAYKVGFTSNLTVKKLIASSLSAIILIICVMLVSEILEKRVSSIQPLQTIDEVTGAKPQTNQMPAFIIGDEKIQPQSNLYMNEGNASQTYIYTIEGKEELILYLNLGIPDDEEFQGEVTIVADEDKKFEMAEDYLKEFLTMPMPLEVPLFFEYEKMTITITGNVKLWDVGFTELKHWWE